MLVFQVAGEQIKGIVQLIYKGSFHGFEVETVLLICPFCGNGFCLRRFLRDNKYIWKSSETRRKSQLEYHTGDGHSLFIDDILYQPSSS